MIELFAYFGTEYTVGILLTAFLPPVVLFIVLRLLRAGVERPKGLCRECGYNLTGNVSGRCPECGAALAGENTRSEA